MQSHSDSIHSPQRILKIIMNEWRKSVKFHLKKQNKKSIIVESNIWRTFSSPWNWIWREMLTGVELSQHLHPQQGEDVDEDEENDGEVGLAAQGGDDDGQQDSHRPPGLRQLEHPHHSHQPDAPHHREAVHVLEAEVQQADRDDHQVKYVPAASEIFFPKGRDLQHGLNGEKYGESLQCHGNVTDCDTVTRGVC